MRQSQEAEEKRQFMFDSLVAGTSLQENLLEQMRFSDMSDDQKPIAEMIIGNIDDIGYLKASVDELAFSTALPQEKIIAVLKIIQGFHPPGVAARDLRECLMIQLERSGREKTLEYRIVRDFMEALGKRKLPEIARGLGISVDQVQTAVERIAHLEYHPGRDFLPDNEHYISPEVFVQKVGDDYVVTTNNEQIPHLRISNHYKDLMAQADASSEVRDYIREKIRAGKFLIKSLQQRQQTILNIGNEIVKRQREFMEKGVAHLKPMTMVQVAEVVGVHETTVSRAVSNKYIDTPQGIFVMKYFFTSGIRSKAAPAFPTPASRTWSPKCSPRKTPPSRSPTRKSSRCSRKKAFPSPAAPSPNTARNSTFSRQIYARYIERSHLVFVGQSQGSLEFFRRNACHFERTPQSAQRNLPVHRNDAATLALRRDFLEDGMAAALAIHEESESLQSFDRLRAGHDGQFSHVPIQTCGSPLAFSGFAGMIQGKGQWPLASWREPPLPCDLGWQCQFPDTRPRASRFLNQDK